jgi:hypothetical protein
MGGNGSDAASSADVHFPDSTGDGSRAAQRFLTEFEREKALIDDVDNGRVVTVEPHGAPGSAVERHRAGSMER